MKKSYKQLSLKDRDRITIEERPLSAETRSRFGHWEGDSIVSRKSASALNTLVERKSRLVLITLLKRKTAQETSTAVIEKLGNLPFTLLSLLLRQTF
jgi:IS30 family transposase